MQITLLSSVTGACIGVLNLEENEVAVYDPITGKKKYIVSGATYGGSLVIPSMSTEERTSSVLKEGELVYDTDEDKIYIGDGETEGGIAMIDASDIANAKCNCKKMEAVAVSSDFTALTTPASITIGDNAPAFIYNLNAFSSIEDAMEVSDLRHLIICGGTFSSEESIPNIIIPNNATASLAGDWTVDEDMTMYDGSAIELEATKTLTVGGTFGNDSGTINVNVSGMTVGETKTVITTGNTSSFGSIAITNDDEVDCTTSVGDTSVTVTAIEKLKQFQGSTGETTLVIDRVVTYSYLAAGSDFREEGGTLEQGGIISLENSTVGSVYGGSVVAAEGTTMTQTGGETGVIVLEGSAISSYVIGGTRLQGGATASIASDTSVQISGGTVGVVVGGNWLYNNAGDGSVLTDSGNHAVTISGGTITNLVVGGCFIQTSTTLSEGQVTQTGKSSTVISGGTFTYSIFGSGIYSNTNWSNGTTFGGDVSIVIDSSSNAIVFGELNSSWTQGSIIGGSYGYSIIDGDVSVTFKGLGSNLTFTGGLTGASSLMKKSSIDTAVTGDSLLAFESFTGELTADTIMMFKSLTVDSNSHVRLTGENADLTTVTAWTISQYAADANAISIDWIPASGQTDTNYTANDFTGDTLVLTMSDDADSWTVMSFVTEEHQAKGFTSAASVTLNGEAATVSESAWESDSYRLRIDSDTKTIVMERKSAATLSSGGGEGDGGEGDGGEVETESLSVEGGTNSDAVTEEAPVEEAVEEAVEETPVEEAVEETPVEETPVAEETATEETVVEENPVDTEVEENPVDTLSADVGEDAGADVGEDIGTDI